MLRRVPRPLALLVAVAALLSIAWTFSTAPFQGPDEPAHYGYTQYLAETGSRPSPVVGTHPDSTQTSNALFFFNLDQLQGVSDARPAWSQAEGRRFDDLLGQLGEKAEDDGSGPNALAKNPPLYYAYEVLPYFAGSLGSFWDRLTVMRLASGLLLLLTVVFTWLAASEVFSRTWPRVIATGSVALLPQLTAVSGTINSDNLLIAVWTAFTFVALRIANRGADVRRVAALAALAVASLLTHGRGTAILPAFAIVLIVAFVHSRPRMKTVLWTVGAAAGILVAGALGYKFLLAPSTGAYGGEINLGTGGRLSITGFINATWQFYFPPLPLMGSRVGPDYGYRQMFIEAFFGRFASLEVGYPSIVYATIQLLAAAGIVGLVVLVVRRRAAVRAQWAKVAVLVGIAVSMTGLLHLASYRALVFSNDPLITGRYLLPLVAVFGLTVAWVLGSLRPRTSALLGTIVLAGLLALNLAGLMLTYTRFYG